jgi:hypothetical protein
MLTLDRSKWKPVERLDRRSISIAAPNTTKSLSILVGSLSTLTAGLTGYQPVMAQTATPSPQNRSTFSELSLQPNVELALKQVNPLAEQIRADSTIAQATPPAPTDPSLNQYLLREPPANVFTGRTGIDSDIPGSSITSPVGFGAEYGSVFASFSYQDRVRFPTALTRNDGSAAIGFGLGDARKAAGFEVVASSASTFRRGFYNVGSVSVKAHRMVSDDTSIALGVENIVNWGGTDGGTSVYGVASKYFSLKDSADEPFSSITASLGLGGGRFRNIGDINNGKGSINPFASVGVRIARPVSFIMDWSGQTLGVGLSIAPIRNVPLTINPAIVDLTNGAGNGARFTIGVGYGIRF